MRQAYDYWQNQPDNYRLSGGPHAAPERRGARGGVGRPEQTVDGPGRAGGGSRQGPSRRGPSEADPAPPGDEGFRPGFHSTRRSPPAAGSAASGKRYARRMVGAPGPTAPLPPRRGGAAADGGILQRLSWGNRVGSGSPSSTRRALNASPLGATAAGRGGGSRPSGPPFLGGRRSMGRGSEPQA